MMGIGEIVEGVDAARRQRERALVARDSLGEAALSPQDVAEIVVERRVAPIARDRRP